MRASIRSVSGPHYLREVVSPGPKQDAEVRRVKNRLVSQVEERRNPRTNATLSQLLDRHLKRFGGAAKTRRTYRGYIRLHIGPFLGKEKVGAVDADKLDAFYAECLRCSVHCDGRPHVQHRTSRAHECDHRCGPHKCEPLAATTIRHMHFILSGAYKRAVRWKWVAVSPIPQAEPPVAPPPAPQPPSPEQAAQIINKAWRDPDWGTLIWTAMTTGARRGELCALRWFDLDLEPERAMAWVRRVISQDEHGRWIEGDTKTHQQRRIALDAETVLVLSEHRDRCRTRAAALGVDLPADGFVFTGARDASRFIVPGSVTQRYDRLAKGLKIKTSLHKLRHYSATELILAGVDIRTVGGRLGHGSGGTTTLRVYAAFVSEADQRAAGALSGRMPARPETTDRTAWAKTAPEAPYQRIAAQLRQDILSGKLPAGQPAPTEKHVAAEYNVSPGTAHRAMDLLKAWGLIEASRGRRAMVLDLPERNLEPVAVAVADSTLDPVPAAGSPMSTMLDLELVHLGKTVRKIRAEADPEDGGMLRRLLRDGIKRVGGQESQIGDYELNVRLAGQQDLIMTFAAVAA
jgi:integrase/DNA-binding transcriptional regulator YhcF (GntR family)